jgi:hypothetical protein
VTGEGVREPSHGGHEVTVDVGRERSGHGPVEAGDVAGEEELAGRPIGPSPHGQVLEEGAQVDHRSLRHRRCHRLVPGEPAPPRALVVPHQEPFDVCPLKLVEAAHDRAGGRRDTRRR